MSEQIVVGAAFVGMGACFAWMAILLSHETLRGIRIWRVRRELDAPEREKDREQREWRKAW